MLKGVLRKRLDNGLTVLLRPNSSASVCCVLTWANVGYLNEPNDLVGISHFLEHMYFKGTTNRPVGAIAKETKGIGGYLNAATIYDYTYYYTVVPAEHASKAIDIQSDALIHPLFDPEEIEREKEVVIQEVKRKYDNPHPYAWEKLLALAFEEHRIRRWRMGQEDDIRQRYSRDALRAYYDRYYCPENLTLVVVGAFDSERIICEIEQKYGGLASREVQADHSPVEPSQQKPKLVRMTGDITRALVKMGFHAPSLSHEDYYPVTFLSILLGRGRSSRLHRSLKEEKGLVDSVTSSFFCLPGRRIFHDRGRIEARQNRTLRGRDMDGARSTSSRSAHNGRD